MPLKSRQLQIPGGFRFYIPQLKWQSTPFASFETIVQGVISARKAHPAMVAKYGWPTDHNTVADEVDAFNTQFCAQMGYGNYIVEGGQVAPPFFHPPRSSSHLDKAKRLVAGGKTIVEWLASGSEAVIPSQSEERAAVCAACPLNDIGDFTRFFTVPVSEAIRAALSQKKDWKLETPYDDRLGVCSACSCPMKLKVHMPLADILKRLKPEDKTNLDSKCWIRLEESALAK
jgi:hypothetical protein